MIKNISALALTGALLAGSIGLACAQTADGETEPAPLALDPETSDVAAPTPSEAAPSEVESASAVDPMAFVRGAQQWGNTCSRCHSMRDPKEFDDAQWQVIVAHMRARAGLTGSDSRDIQRFLQQSN